MNRFLKYIIVFVFMLVVKTSIAGCDMCSMYLGIHPNQTKNSISLRYRFSLYESSKAHNHSGGNASHITGTEWRTFQTLETWGQWRVNNKLQLLFMAPFAMNSIENKGLVLDSYNSLGDIQTLARYQIFRSDAEDHNFIHRIVIGFGIKAPTGRFKVESNEGLLDPHIQTGTGSWDLIYNIGYLLKYNSWGINEEFLFKQNGKNSLEYKFADRISSNTSIFYNFEKNDLNIMPSLGYLFEYANKDKLNDQLQNSTNGKVHYVVPGVDLYYKKFNWNISYQKPIQENLRDVNMNNNYRWLIGMGFAF